MKPITITLRLAAAFCLLGAVLFVVGWQGVSRLQRLNAQAQNIVYSQWREERLANEALHVSDTNSQITLLVFLLDDPEEIKQLLVRRAANTQRISELVSAIEPLLEPGKETELFAAVKATRTPYLESYQRALSLLLTEHQPEEARKMMVDVVRPKLAAYHEAWNAFDQHQVEQIDAIEWQSQIDFAADERDFLLILALAGFMTGGIAIFTVARMAREIAVRHRAERCLQEAHGQLERRIVERTADLKKANEALQAENAERRRGEEALLLLSSAVEQSKESIIITDREINLPGPKIIFVNPAFTQMTGYTAGEVRGKTPRILQGPRTDKAVLRRLRQSLEEGKVFEGEAINYRKGGEEFNLEWQVAPIRGSDGVITNFVAIQRDITERKRAEEALRESEERFAGAFEHAPIGVALVSPVGRWLKVNRALCNLIGYSEEELLGRTVFDLTHPDEVKVSLENMRRTIAGEIRSFQLEKRYMHKSGRVVMVWLNVSLVRSGRGEPRYFIALLQDITERKRLEARLFQSQKMETIGKLAGGIAHEFNSILTAIIGQSELMLGDLPSGSPLAKSAKEIGKAAERAAVLTRQLLAYGRKQILQPKILDLNSVLAGMEGTLRHLMGPGTDVLMVPGAGLVTVKIDPGQLDQVIVNLVMNAAEAMPNGGKLTLETTNVSIDEESVGRYPDLKPGDYVMLAITDTGAGMSAEVKARVFEPFFTTKGVGEGTGLGLSTCYGIVKQSGGHISLYSEPGRGTTFKIYLPQAEPEAKIPLQRLDSPGMPRGTETILLVEDDPALREMAATLLRRLGYTVLAAANGLEALSLKQQRGTGHVDLLFTDVVMPHMSGRELADRVRALYPQTRILFTSAYTENAIVHQGVLDKGVALLQKPFTPGALARKLREVLDQPREANVEAAPRLS